MSRPRGEPWVFVCADRSAGEGWAQLCSTAPSATDEAWLSITTDPRRHDHRQHRLKGDLGTRLVNGVPLEQWQYEPTGGGRIWYCIDDERRTVHLTLASTGHPKQTE